MAAEARGRASTGSVGSYPRRTRLLALGMLGAIWLAFTFPAFAGKARFPMDFPEAVLGVPGAIANPELGDAFFVEYPWHAYLGKRLREGHLPLWDPHRFGGTPFAANPVIGVWYPPNLIFATGHTLLGLTVVAIGSMLAALLLAYWFLRVEDLHPYAAVAGAAGFVFSAFIFKWSAHTSILGSSMWLPLILGGLEVARRGRARRGVLLAGAGLALSVLGGHAQVALYVWAAAGLWAAVGIVASAAQARAAGGQAAGVVLRGAGRGAAAFALGLGLAAVQIVPAAEMAGQIVRQKETYERMAPTALWPRHLGALLIPDYYGNPVDRNSFNYRGDTASNYTETALYAGILALPLAVVGLVHRRGRLPVFLGLITAIGFLAVFGAPFALRTLAALPAFSRMHFVTRFILYLDLGLTALAAVGLDVLLRPSSRRRVATLAIASAAVLAALAVLTLTRPWTPLPAGYLTPRGLRAMLIVAAGAAAGMLCVKVPSRAGVPGLAVVALVGVDLWFFGFHYHTYDKPRPVIPRARALERLEAEAGPRARYANFGASPPPNSSLNFGLYDLGGYDVFILSRFVELAGIADDQRLHALRNWVGPFRLESFDSPIMDLLGVRFAITGPDDAVPGNRVGGPGFAIVERSPLPAAFVATCWELLPPESVLPRLFTMTSPELRSTVLAQRGDVTRAQLPATPAPGCPDGPAATIERYEPERVVLRTPPGPAGVLVLTDVWYRGWRATVDGRGAPVLRVDHTLRGVRVGQGAHRVELEFRPWSLQGGGAASILSILSALALLLWRRSVRPQAGREAEASPARAAYPE
ncbi:MAG: hypothetical protein ACRDJ4_13515 [Actinomycetota bacterium]